MENIWTKIKESVAASYVKKFLSSSIFPFVTAFVALLGYYVGGDLVTIYYLVITGLLILLLLDDITPCITMFLFMPVLISLKNSPSLAVDNSDFYMRTENLVQIAVLITLYLSAAVFRLAKSIKSKSFKLTPVFIGLCAFAAALLLNGLLSENYDPKNLVYGLIMAACFLFIFVVYKDNIKLDKNAFKLISVNFVALGALLSIELLIAYITTEGLLVNGVIHRGFLKFGWGTYNNFGVLLVMCIPPVVYLGFNVKYGYIYTLVSAVLFICTFLSCSRQTMLASLIIYPVSLIIMLAHKQNRAVNAGIVGVMAIIGIVLLCVYRENVMGYFKTIFESVIVNGELSGNGRVTLWEEAWNNFKSAPLLGVGFYTQFSYDEISGLGFVPLMCHNTVLQLLSSCGTLGLAAYAVHRVQTAICLFKRPTADRVFIALSIAAMLITCLLDNHIFYIFPTIIYSALIAVLVKSQPA